MTYSVDREVFEICRDLIRLDTSNFGDESGPGERAAAEYVAGLLEEVGISATLLEPVPGRTSVLARWGNQNSPRPGLLVHGHLDVVPAEASDWSFDPFAGHVEDGFLYGRGAIDMKDFDAMVLSVVRARQRAGDIPDRPITLAFTADEEAGGARGAQWLVDQHAEWFEGCSEAVGEVGGFSTEIGGQRLYLIGAGEKGISWIRLRAEGVAGHGSMRQDDSAVARLLGALSRLEHFEWPAEPGPSMAALLDKVRELSDSPSTDPDTLLAQFGPAVRMIGAGIRNSTNTTMLSAGYKHNVVPASAEAAVDGRFLPADAERFLARITEIIGDPRVSIRADLGLPALEYPFEGDLVDAMTLALHSQDPTAHIAPYLWSGGTDTKAWSRLGIGSFGFAPLRLPPELDFTALFHGVDERVPVDALMFGARVFHDFLKHV